jgi:hypothetical protein
MEPPIEHFYGRLARAYAALGLGLKIAIALGGVLITTAVGLAMVIWIPSNHFTVARREASRGKHPILRFIGLLIRNTSGFVLIVLGAVMALPLVPGPGLVFILLGFSITDFPGKRRIERRLLGVPSVIGFLNNVRIRFGRPPLVLDPPTDERR